ncbi:MAG: Abasic site processing protein [Actinomycetota bacterium]|jgi:putative SOS response-associated peptidase YedK|nr:Abasic site processing protein [Actinomycetota bacterium]
MCGRYASAKEPAELIEEFGVTHGPETPLAPDFNVAPTKQVYAVLDRGAGTDGDRERLLAEVRWGLVPSWAKDPKIGSRMINARLETAAVKPAFRSAWARRRALLPADGYYEWHTASAVEGVSRPRKQPYFIHLGDGGTLAMAGLYELWRDPSKDPDHPESWLWTATVLTTTATDGLGRIHDRMPVHVFAEQRDDWLDPGFTGDPGTLLEPAAAAARMVAYPVSSLVNSVRNNGPELTAPIPLVTG